MPREREPEPEVEETNGGEMEEADEMDELELIYTPIKKLEVPFFVPFFFL